MKPQRALNVLKWVYLGYRPLSLVELQHALATKPGDTTFNTEGIPSEELLVECCLGLVVVEAETLTVRLTHYTLREFFDKHWKDSDLFPFGHSTIAATCLSYLQFDHDVPPPSHEEWSYGYFERLKKPPSPLLQYSIENVGRHLKTNRDRAVAEQCIAVLEQGEKFQLLELATHDSNNTSLHWAAYWGCISVVELLIGSDGVNAESPTQQVPPPYAASQMAETVVTRPGVNINARSEDGHTPLSLAVWRGHDEVVRLLLGTPGVDLSVIDKGGDTPLSFASWRGQEDVIRLLVDTAGIDVDASEENNFTPPTPLSTAALEGYEELLRLLVDAPGVDINAHDVDGKNPFLKAARRGHEEVVRLLLGVPGVGVNMKNKHGNTPLSVAAWYGLEAVIRLLLGVPGIDVNECDKDGDSPLCSAAYRGYEGIVRLLLSTPGIDINLPNNKGESPLSCAAANGHGALVQLLLATPGIDAT
jgi:ankyrin repeat protein